MEYKLPRFPVMLRQMWSGGEVQKWLDENIAPLFEASPTHKWVKVSERLPTIDDSDEGGNIWVWDGTDVHSIGWFNAVAKEVTHWMPKPCKEPPAPPGEGREK